MIHTIHLNEKAIRRARYERRKVKHPRDERGRGHAVCETHVGPNATATAPTESAVMMKPPKALRTAKAVMDWLTVGV